MMRLLQSVLIGVPLVLTAAACGEDVRLPVPAVWPAGHASGLALGPQFDDAGPARGVYRCDSGSGSSGSGSGSSDSGDEPDELDESDDSDDLEEPDVEDSADSDEEETQESYDDESDDHSGPGRGDEETEEDDGEADKERGTEDKERRGRSGEFARGRDRDRRTRHGRHHGARAPAWDDPVDDGAPDHALDDEGFDVRDDEVLITELDDANLAALEAQGYRVARRERLNGLGLTLATLRLPPGADLDEAVDALESALPDRVVDYNHLYGVADVTASGTPDAPASGAAKVSPAVYGALLGLPSTVSVPSENVRIGLIDTAVETTHPVFENAHFTTADFAEGDGPRPSDHGTAVAAILTGLNGSTYRGLLTGSSLYAANAFHFTAAGQPRASAGAIVRALDWLVSNRVPVINLSLTGPPNRLVKAAVAQATMRGHILFAAVGNGGPAAPAYYPAAYDGVLAITAIDGALNPYRHANRGHHVDFAAPGVHLYAAQPGSGFGFVSGTSYATPFAAAVAAVKYLRIDTEQRNSLIKRLRAHARDLGRPGVDPVFGHGLIQALQETDQ